LAGTLGIIVVANVINRLSYGTRITNAALVQVQQELEECAQLCGARNATIMWRIIVPLVKPSLVYAGLWTAMLTFREVSMALMLSESHNRVLSISIWGLWQTGNLGINLGIAAAGAVVMVLTMGVLMVFTLRFAGSSAVRQRRGG
jgi:ABC-type Fe3+ transport system permease subunit